jgi:hypothetical protein
MQKIYTETDLDVAIFQLEIKQAEEGKLLKEQFYLTYESLKPANLLKSTFLEVASSPFSIGNILSTAVGLGTGFLSKKIVIGASGNIFKKLFGSVLQLGVTSVVAQHPDAVKSIGQFIFQKIFHKKDNNRKSLDR